MGGGEGARGEAGTRGGRGRGGGACRAWGTRSVDVDKTQHCVLRYVQQKVSVLSQMHNNIISPIQRDAHGVWSKLFGISYCLCLQYDAPGRKIAFQ